MSERVSEIAFEEEAKTMNREQLYELAKQQAIKLDVGLNLRMAINGMKQLDQLTTVLVEAQRARIAELELEILHKDRTITELREIVNRIEEAARLR